MKHKSYYQKHKIIIIPSAIIFGIALLFFIFKDIGKQYHTEKGDDRPTHLYGIELKKNNYYNGQVEKGELFSTLFLKNGVDYTTIHNIVEQSKNLFNVRKMRVGNNYTIISTNDTTNKMLYFIYEIDKINYIVYDLRDSIKIDLKQKEVTTLTQTASGVIQSSLYETMYKNNLSPSIAGSLANIYAWTIDFYNIQKDDKFKVIYDEKFIEGKSIGVSKIHSAVFEHKGKNFYAIYFEQNDVGDYFDEKNNSLRNLFLKAPLNFSRISSKFSKNRFHPVQQRWKAHLGTDYAASTGTPIWSTANGTVIAAQYQKFNGNYVKIKHNNTYTTQYLHMSKIASGIRTGTKVRQGQTIGFVGSTGLATGPHVCYRFWVNNKQCDPYSQKFPSSNPVSKGNLEAYNLVKKNNIEKLEKIKFNG